MRHLALLALLGCAHGNAGDPMQRSIDDARRAASKKLGVSASDLDVITDAESVPGLLVFHATFTAPPRVKHVGGVVADGEVILDGPQAMGRVYQAWGYGPDRTRSAEQVAAVAVHFVPSAEPSRVLGQGAADLSYARRKFPDAAPPADTELEGRPGVRFWVEDPSNPVTEIEVAPGATAGAPALLRAGRSHGGG